MGWVLAFASDELKADREIVLAAVTDDGRALEDASEELRADHEVVLLAVTHDGRALQYASEELKADREIVLAAVANHPGSGKFVAEDVKNNPLMVAEFIRLEVDPLWENTSEAELKLQLTRVLQHIPYDVAFSDNTSVLEYVQANMQAVWHTIWLVMQMAFDTGQKNEVLEYVGVSLELQHAKELLHCAPVIGAAVEHQDDWRQIFYCLY